MLSKIIAAMLVTGLAIGGVGRAAMAEGGDVKQLHDLLTDFYDCPADVTNNDCINGRTASQNEDGEGNEVITLGDAISAGWMGNTANRRDSWDGNGIVPGLNPGPSPLLTAVTVCVARNGLICLAP